MADFETEIRHAFERRLAAKPPRPDLRTRINDAVAVRRSRPQAWRVVAASAALLLVGAATFSVLLARGQRTHVIGPTPSAHASPTCVPSSPAALAAPSAQLGGVITTVAGGGVAGDVPNPYAVAVNSSGVIYIGDGVGLRRVGTDGNISTNMQYVNSLAGTTGVAVAPRQAPAAPPGQPSAAIDLLYATQFSNDLVVQVGSQPRGDIEIGRAILVDGAKGPVGIVATQQTGVFYLAASTSNRVLKVTVPPGQSVNSGQWQTSSCVVAQSPAVSQPAGLALDALGNLYIADSGSNRIRAVGVDGTIRTVAGTGTAGFTGDGGPAVKAQLNGPAGLAVDASGALFIADTGNNRIRRVSPDGTITTVAGSGAKGYSGDGGPAVNAKLSGPTGVAIGPDGALYIADSGNNRIRKSARPSASHAAQPGWKTYVSGRWGYSIDYPSDWYDLPNSGAPDTQKYFSNEKVGAPLQMTDHGVWETIEVQPNSSGSCAPGSAPKYVIRQSATTVDGEAATRYVIDMTPSGGERAYIISAWVMHGGSCYSIQFLSQTAPTRDANAGLADQAIASFRFGS
jgi:sugar lactone lactonase YvrE